MRILVGMTTVRRHGIPATDPFVLAWRNFILRHGKSLPCDFVIVGGNGFPPGDFARLTSGVAVIRADPWDQASGLNVPLLDYGAGYDYVIRVDHDAFPSAKMIATICDFLEKHPDVDIIGATHSPRCVTFDDQDAAAIWRSPHPNKSSVPCCAPWNVPNNNGDLWGLRMQFYARARADYQADERCHPHFPPLLTTGLNYGAICDLLGFFDPRVTKTMRRTLVRFDGSFRDDFFTHMCKLKPLLAGIVSPNGKSFHTKNQLREFVTAMTFNSWDTVVDRDDTAWPCPLNAYTDEMMHMEAGYVTDWYLVPNSDRLPWREQPAGSGVASQNGNFYWAHYAVYRMLLKEFCPDVFSAVEPEMQKFFASIPGGGQVLMSMVPSISEFYSVALKDYM